MSNMRGASDSITDSSMFSNLADAQNVSYLGLRCGDNCPKNSALYGPCTFNPQFLVSMKINKKYNLIPPIKTFII